MAVIEAHELTKAFRDLVAVDHVSFAVDQGSIVGFLGPNGAGKTTTLRMLLGLVTPTSGTATINGRPYGDLAAPLHSVGAVLETSGAHPGRRARDHLRLAALLGGAPAARVDEVLDLVGLTGAAGRRVGTFSLGMRQRLGLATALLCDPEVLILDEPANGLDPEGVHWLRGLLRDLAGEGRTVVVSSHLLSEVAQTVDRVLIIDGGRLVANALLDELTVATTIRVRTPRPEELAGVLERQGAIVAVVSGDRLEVTGASSEQVGTLAAALSIPVFEITTEAADLEEVFLQLTTDDHHREVTQ